MSNVVDDEWVGTKVLFENDQVRVWDFQLRPGESSKLHTHRRDWLYVYTTDDNQLRFQYPGLSDVERSLPDGYVVYSEVDSVPPERLTHQVTNIGSKLHRQIVVEIKGSVVPSE